MAAPAVVLVGCAVNTTFAAAPADTLNAPLVAAASPVALRQGVSRPHFVDAQGGERRHARSCIYLRRPAQCPAHGFVPMAIAT